MQEAKRTPLYENHLRHGGKMVEFGGWALPVQYGGIKQEHMAVREACGLFDVSHMGEILLTGPDALPFLNYVCTNDFTSLEVGRCRYSPMCYEDGGCVDDLIIYKMGEEKYLIIANASNCGKDFAWLQSRQGAYPRAILQNISEEVAQLALQGPAYRDLLERAGLVGNVPDKPYAFIEDAKVAGVPCLLSTTGYTGEPGVELYTAPGDAPALFEALLAAGAVPCGLGARDTLRFEASMPLYGHELSESITPLECGLKSFVKMDKPDFIGKAALMAKPAARRRIGLQLLDKGIAREHCPVLDGEGNPIGETTSGGPAPALNQIMAMALVTLTGAESERFFIEVRGRRLAAQRVKLPFYKTPHK